MTGTDLYVNKPHCCAVRLVSFGTNLSYTVQKLKGPSSAILDTSFRIPVQFIHLCPSYSSRIVILSPLLQGGSNMTGTDLYVNKPHCAAAVRP